MARANDFLAPDSMTTATFTASPPPSPREVQ
jgi:hypothetical protein